MRPRLFASITILAWLALGVSAHADTLILSNGDKLNGEIVEWAVDHVVIEHDQLGTLRLALDQLELDTGTPPNPGLFHTRFLRGWSRRIDVGITGEESDESTTTINVGTRLDYEDPWTKWRMRGRYFYNASDDDSDDDNNATATLVREWLTPGSRWFRSLGTRYQFDEFESWEHRIALFGGPGFHLVDTESHSLDLSVGPAFTREFGTSDSDQSEVLIALAWDWTISERQSLDMDNNYFNQFSPDAGQGRNFSTLTWSLRLTERPVLSLNIGLQNEYETDPEDGDSHNDLKYFITIGLDL